MGKYIYTSLQPDRGEIRLLRLLPGDTSANIEIEILHTRLKSSPKYEALSYVWGSPERRHNISVGERVSDKPDHFSSSAKGKGADKGDSLATLAATKNLTVALLHLRYLHEPRILWIDAICINQEDVSERSVEVGNMGSIYARAQQVIVWLGPKSENSSLAIKTLETIGKDVEYSRSQYTYVVSGGSQTECLENDPQAMRSMVANWIAIRDLLKREWFTRLWIIQEIGLASRAIIAAGKDTLQWDTFQTAVSWIGACVQRQLKLSDLISLEDLEPMRCLFHSVIGKEGPSLSLPDLLDLTKNSQCLDPRDRLYGILSLLRPAEHTGMRIRPTYSKPAETVYKNCCLRYLKFRHRLDLLPFCEAPNIQSGLEVPSWVPDLSSPLPTPTTLNCQASGLSAAAYHYKDSEDSLQVFGLQAATVANISIPISRKARLPEILAICHAWEPPELRMAEYIGGGSLMDAFVVTLTCGMAKGVVSGTYYNFPDLEYCKKAFEKCVVKGKEDKTTVEYTDKLQIALPSRAFFTTKEGYIGLAPATARPGDQVVVLLGCSVPMLLRPVSGKADHYQVVGKSFVHGLMLGEALLGQLPSGQEHRWENIDGSYTLLYASGSKITQEDPRLRTALPPGWKVTYGINRHHSEYDNYGNIRGQMFYNERTQEGTWLDPRMSPENLRERGKEIRDFILI